ncbi:MAG: uroporphyrinogen-III synthase [Burkholderiales bacterium]
MSALAGRGILITRPAHQSASLAERVRAVGGEPILFPALEIADLVDPAPLNALVARLAGFDWAVFVSPNAASRALQSIRAHGVWPTDLRAAAVGRGTVRELNRQGVASVVAPQTHFDSEALLECPELQAVAGRRIVIFRGDGGRETLGDTLAARGAQVEYAACYRRVRPAADPAARAALLARWTRGDVQAVTAASAETLANLFVLLGEAGAARLCGTPVFVPHARIAQAARELGVATVTVTAAGEEGLVAGLTAWFARAVS